MKPFFIDHIAIIVSNIKVTEAFYSKFLGEPIQSDDEQIAYQIGQTKIFFGLPYSSFRKHDKDTSSLNHLAFGVHTLEELRQFEATLNKTGIKHSGISIDKYGQKEFIWFDDPDGYRLEFYCRSIE
jgi:catechol-2,3-dioxygenase